MPSKELACEFCNKLFRKNELARHTKAKHTEELAQYLLQEYIEEPQHNSLKRYASLINPKNNPIYSKLHHNGCYYFGANPSFFEDDDSYGTYIASDENMKIHNAFLAELVSHISLADFFKAERDIQVKSEEVKTIQNELKEIKKHNRTLIEEIDSLKSRNRQLQDIVKDFQEATECSTTISQMKFELNDCKSLIRHYESEIESYKQKYKNLEENLEDRILTVYEDARQRSKDNDKLIDELMKTNVELKDEVNKLKTKREADINTKVEKESKKMKDKIAGYKDEIDELQDQIDTLTRENKRLKRNVKRSRSDDSDSDNDSKDSKKKSKRVSFDNDSD